MAVWSLTEACWQRGGPVYGPRCIPKAPRKSRRRARGATRPIAAQHDVAEVSIPEHSPTAASRPEQHVEEPWGEEQVPDTRRERLLELVVTVLLGRRCLIASRISIRGS